MAVEQQMKTDATDGVVATNLTYSFPGGEPFLKDFCMSITPGSRCLLLGCNGAGKTTLLQILAGRFMVDREMIRVVGRSPFHDLVRTAFSVQRASAWLLCHRIIHISVHHNLPTCSSTTPPLLLPHTVTTMFVALSTQLCAAPPAKETSHLVHEP